MATLAALAAGPVGFTDVTSGSQLFVPTPLIFFEDGTAHFTPPAGMNAATVSAITDWLAALARAGTITPAASPPPVPAAVISAKSAGPAGNTIEIAVSNVRPKPTDASKTIFDATVTETSRYTLITPVTLKAVLGTSATNGSQPGLVFVSSAGAPSQPANGTTPLAGDPATVEIAKQDASPGAFSLTARAAGPDGALTTVTITNADDAANPGTFTLEAVWTKAAAGIEVTELATVFAYELTVAPPQGGSLAAPAAGAYALSGGAAARTAANASVTVPTGS